MADEIEDPIEAIKRRNEERARRLKERIARGEFDRFDTPLEEVDETLAAGAESLEAPESEFDLSSFPAPPEPSAIPLEEERAEERPGRVEFPPMAPPEFPPEFAPPFGPAAAGEPAEPELAPTALPPEDVFAGLELTELDLEGVSEVIAPQPWDTAEAPPVEAAAPPEAPPIEAAAPAEAPPAEEEVPAEVGPPPGLEIEVEARAETPLAEVIVPPFEEVVPAEEELVAVGEPTLGEEEAEAIKATIEEELREIPPAAPPMPPRPEEVPVGVAAEAAPPEVEAPAEKEEAEIFIGIGVMGNKVRVERRNITLAGAIDLFKSIIDRYQNR